MSALSHRKALGQTTAQKNAAVKPGGCASKATQYGYKKHCYRPEYARLSALHAVGSLSSRSMETIVASASRRFHGASTTYIILIQKPKHLARKSQATSSSAELMNNFINSWTRHYWCAQTAIDSSMETNATALKP